MGWLVQGYVPASGKRFFSSPKPRVQPVSYSQDTQVQMSPYVNGKYKILRSVQNTVSHEMNLTRLEHFFVHQPQHYSRMYEI